MLKKLKGLVSRKKSKIGYAANNKYRKQSKKEVEEGIEEMKEKYDEE